MNDIPRAMTPDDAARGRAAYLTNSLVPYVTSVFQQQPRLRSMAFFVGQYWFEEALDAVHYAWVFSELPLPQVGGGLNAEQVEAVNLPNGPLQWGGDGYPPFLEDWDDNGASIPLFAACCPANSNMDMDPTESHVPYAVFTRRDDSPTIDSIEVAPTLLRPQIDGIAPMAAGAPYPDAWAEFVRRYGDPGPGTPRPEPYPPARPAPAPPAPPSTTGAGPSPFAPLETAPARPTAPPTGPAVPTAAGGAPPPPPWGASGGAAPPPPPWGAGAAGGAGADTAGPGAPAAPAPPAAWGEDPSTPDPFGLQATMAAAAAAAPEPAQPAHEPAGRPPLPPSLEDYAPEGPPPAPAPEPDAGAPAQPEYQALGLHYTVKPKRRWRR